MNAIEKLTEKVLTLEKKIRKMEKTQKAPNHDFLTEREVKEWLGVSRSTLNNYAKKGLLVPTYPNSKKKYKRQDVIDFMKGM